MKVNTVNMNSKTLLTAFIYEHYPYDALQYYYKCEFLEEVLSDLFIILKYVMCDKSY